MLPVLRDGAVVATLQASELEGVGHGRRRDREWVFSQEQGRADRPAGPPSPRTPSGCGPGRRRCWKGTWTAELEGTPVEVQSTVVWKGTHRYLAGGRQVAESGTTGGWSPRPTLTADDALPLDHQVFLLWLELVISRRNTAAVAAAAGAAVIGGSS